MSTQPIDPRTNRPLGDHGTANDAIEFAMDVLPNLTNGCPEADTFLRAWREGDAFDEWPEFYEWLGNREKRRTN